MERRTVFRAGLAATLGMFGLSRAAAAPSPAPAKQKVVYHCSEPERVAFVMGNIQNHVAGTGGPGGADIRLVVHGPALKNFHALVADENFTKIVEKARKDGVGFDACANTMRAQGVKIDDLLAGFAVAEKGGVVRLAELQQQGYAYIRP
jgi:intracellular sulfur oxidation DsrE/DsrF family protein